MAEKGKELFKKVLFLIMYQIYFLTDIIMIFDKMVMAYTKVIRLLEK